ncbi:MAG: CocE/NonD family hydrolase [Acidobacteriaceae bacterium]|jgi:putative CocE/NonD family hydrolase
MRSRQSSSSFPVLLLALWAGCAGACAQDLAQYVGQYRSLSSPDQVTAVYLEGGALYEESAQRQRQRLVPDRAAQDRFTIATPQAHVEFLRNPANSITGLKVTLDSDGRTLVEAARFSAVGIRLNHARAYTRQEAMIPMRDSVRLHAVILVPEGDAPQAGWPFLLARTPYGVEEFDSQKVSEDKPELAASGYIYVYEDIRGRYGSQGQFVMNRPIVAHQNSSDVDETTDAYDTVAWLLKNVPGNNGRVGVFGLSYDGFLAIMAGIGAHPAVKAISPQAPMTDVWMGDDFFHNGAFREAYGFDYVQQMEGQRTDVRVNLKQDTYDFFLHHTNFAGAAAAAKMGDLPTAKAFLTQPEYTKFWRDMAVEYHLTRVEVPTLEVGGYWDQEDMWGTQAEYAALKPHDSAHEVFMALGPWDHGGWHGSGRTLGSDFGRLDFGEPTGTEFRRNMEFPFFEKYLKDKPGFDVADTESFRTGANKWERYDAWPPVAGFAPARLYLEPGKTLSFVAPPGRGDAAAATYVADPADPVPYRHRPIQSTYAPGSKWYTWLVEDQRFVTGRKDVASFTLAPLDHDVTITGDVTADLFAATTGSDADWVVKLIDVTPDDSASNPGYQLMVAEEIFRGRYLNSFEQPEPLKPGAVNEFKWSLHGVDHTFLKGHSIMVEVQSSWFPLYDRNPQTFVPNIMTAPKKAYKAETVTIYGSPQYPSHLEFEVAK